MLRYVIGIATLAVMIASLAVATNALRRRYMPELDRPTARLAQIVVALSVVIVALQILGTFGLFALVPIVVVVAAGGVAAYARHRAPAMHAVDPPTTNSRAPVDEKVAWGRYAGVFAVAVAVAAWTMRTVDSLHHGITATVDALWYHLPYAARFAQTGYTSRLQFPDAGSYTVFFPASSELLHGLGIVLLGSDVLSPLLNLGWLALALFAGWCIGRRFGVGSIALIGVTIVLTMPELVLDDAGSPLTDVIGLALFLALIAPLLAVTPAEENEHRGVGTVTCAGLAAGLALGTKYTMIAPVGLLTLGVIAIAIRRKRAMPAISWTIAMLVTGSYWYLRNLIRVGNPLPSLSLGLGPVHLNYVKTPGVLTVTRIMFHRHDWSAYILPGLSAAFGRVWWAILGLAFIGWVLGALRGPGFAVRVIAAVGIASFLVYLVSPEMLGSVQAPTQFVVNVRYCAAALLVGFVVLPVAATTLRRRWISVVLVAYVLTLVLTQVSPTIWAHRLSGIASATEGWMPEVVGIVLGVVTFVVGCVWLATASRTNVRGIGTVPVVIVAVVLVAGGFVLDRYYVDHRYQNVAYMTNIFRWASDVSDARIGIVGTFLQYPLDGKDSSNYVQYLANRHADGRSTPIATCQEWRRALNAGHFDYVVVTTNGFPFASTSPAPQLAWTETDPAVSLVTQDVVPAPGGSDAKAWLFKIHGELDPHACSTNTASG